MEKANKTNAQTAKEKKLKIALSVTAILLVLVIAWLLILKNTGAWLLDKGEWSDANYTLGYIDYTYEVNDKNVDIKGDTMLAATVPLIGGVKLNDQAENTSASHYEAYAEENFNEGITVVHIRIVNKSTFPFKMDYELLFENMFDAADSKDIFYLILPQGASVDTVKKTITTKDEAAVGYKQYVKTILGESKDYNEMKNNLTAYYKGAGSGLKKSSVEMTSQKQEGKEEALELNILFWSEYNDNLPFVTTTDGKEQLKPNDASSPASLEGTFTLKINSSQQQRNTDAS